MVQISNVRVLGDPHHLADHNEMTGRIMDVRDYASIYAAVAAMSGGGHLYVPGVYTIGPAPLVLPSNLHLFGDGYSSQIIAWANSGFTHIPAEDVPSSYMSAMIYGDGSNITIDRLRITGAWPGSGAGTDAHNVLFGVDSADCKLLNCILENAGW